MDLEAIRKKRRQQEQQRVAADMVEQQYRQADKLKKAVDRNATANIVSGANVENAVNNNTDQLSNDLKTSSQTLLQSLSEQNSSVADALNNLVVATVIARDPQLVEVITQFTTLLDNLASASDKLGSNPLNDLPSVNKQLVKALQDFSKQESKEPDYTAKFDALEKAVNSLELKPVVNVPKTNVNIDIATITAALDDVRTAIANNKVKIPPVKMDDVVTGLDAVKTTIANLSFPVPNYVLPFQSDGKAAQVPIDASGRPTIVNNASRGNVGSQTTTISNSSSETTIITATAATYHDLISIFISNTSATAVRVDIRDTTTGSVIFQIFIPAGDMRGVSLTTPWPQTAINTNWTAQSSNAVTDLRVSALYINNT